MTDKFTDEQLRAMSMHSQRISTESAGVAQEACSPTLTECPRCKNDFRKCDLTFAGKSAAVVAQEAGDWGGDTPAHVYVKPPSFPTDTQTTAQEAGAPGGYAEFADYVARNYHAGTVISDPLWHAPRLYRAALRASAPIQEAGAREPVARKVKWTFAPIPPVAWCEHIQAHPLFEYGDTVLVWVNEGDIIACGERIVGRTPPATDRTTGAIEALREIVAVLGPSVPDCLNCQGCEVEWNRALTVAKEALAALAPPST
jgi:hypothetical protein